MKKAMVYFTETNKRLASKERRSLTIEVPDVMFDTWDWDGIVEKFRWDVRTHSFSDSTIHVKRIKLGRTVLQGRG